MILLPTKRTRKLQAGGGIDRYIIGAGSQFTPVQYNMPGYASLYKPMSGGRSGAGSGSRRRPTSGKKEDRLSAKGFSNDIEYAFNKRDRIANSISSRAQDSEYLTSPEYTNDYKELQASNREIAQLNSIKKDFEASMKGKNIEGGSYAIHNNQALVRDKTDNSYKLVSLQDAMSNRNKYNIETISTAQNLRSRDSKFHGFSESGKFLQEMILNSYNSKDLYDSVDDAFDSAGVTSDIGSMISLSDGTKIDADDFYRYIASGLNVKATTMTEATTNETQLKRGVQSMMGRVTSNPGTMSAYRNYAIGRMLDGGIDVSNMSKKQFDATVHRFVQDDLLGRMKVFVDEKFSTKFKEATKKKTSSGGKAEDEKITMHTNATILSQANPHGFFQAEHESLFEGETASLGITSSMIDNSHTFVEEGFVGRTDVPAYSFLNKNRNIQSMVDGDLRTSFSLFNGIPLASLNEGRGIQSAVVPDDQNLEVLHMVPVVKDPNTGDISVDIQYLQFMDLYKKTADNAIAAAKLPIGDAGAGRAKEIKVEVKEALMQNDPEFRQFINGIEGGQVVFRNMLAMDILIPEDMENAGITTMDEKAFGKYMQLVDDADYMALSGEDSRDAFSSSLFGIDEIYRVKVFAPVKPISRQEMSQFKGVEKFSMKEAEFRRWQQSLNAEQKEYSRYNKIEDLI